MQLEIKHRTGNGLRLPISYHQILQGIIYKGLDCGDGYSKYIHDRGIGYNGPDFKFFTFGLLKGKYRIRERQILFPEEVSFEVRSPDLYFIRVLSDSILKNGISYYNSTFENVEIRLTDRTVESEDILIKMESPLVARKTDSRGKSTYFTPGDEEFYAHVKQNFIKKYYSCYGILPEEEIELELVNEKSLRKDVTKFKDINITGWFGEFRLKGKRKYLDFLYQSGLGEKNSQGFGMFEIIG